MDNISEQDLKKVSDFREIISKETNSEAEAIIAKAEAQRNALLDKTRADHERKLAERIVDAENRYRDEGAKQISKEIFVSSRDVIKSRADMTEEFFSGIENRLRVFVSGAHYEKFLLGSLKKQDFAQPFGKAVIEALPRDKDIVQKAYPDTTVVAVSAIRLGGVRVKYEGGKLFADLTIDCALERERAVFCERSELRL
ncbi:MAG: hypothetical protein LBN40_05070 [Oscillospiraceae bacterium]|jgi:vacuolar-type H+-ATPase subunit E/Vma4|nr:hypothetical protein [Oscillospiraceae bacterium]